MNNPSLQQSIAALRQRITDAATAAASAVPVGHGEDRSNNGSKRTDSAGLSLVSPKAAVDELKTDGKANQSTYRDFSHVKPDAAEIRSSSSPSIASPGKAMSTKEPTFTVKLHMILSNPDFHDVITWLPHGRSWRILQQKAFEERVIPLYFRHGRYSSFARQVNGWGFRRITHGGDYNSYYHELFLRGMPHLCHKMRRLTSKDMANRKKVDETNIPDFFAISRDNPLPKDIALPSRSTGMSGNQPPSGSDETQEVVPQVGPATTSVFSSSSIVGSNDDRASSIVQVGSTSPLTGIELAILERRRAEILANMIAAPTELNNVRAPISLQDNIGESSLLSMQAYLALSKLNSATPNMEDNFGQISPWLLAARQQQQSRQFSSTFPPASVLPAPSSLASTQLYQRLLAAHLMNQGGSNLGISGLSGFTNAPVNPTNTPSSVIPNAGFLSNTSFGL